MDELLFKPGPDPFGLCPLIWIGDPVQRTVFGNPRQMGLHRETRTVRIGIAARLLLTLCPEPPTFLRRHKPSMAQGVEIPKVPGSTTLHQGDHLARYQVGEPVEINIGPRKSGRRFELGGAGCNLKAEDGFPAAPQRQARDLTPMLGPYLAIRLQCGFDGAEDAVA